MDRTAFGSSPAGSLAPTIGGQFAFVPHDLPPELDLSALLVPLTQATQALGQLNGVMTTLPDPYLLIRPLEAREALTSSSMEGTYTTVDALLLAEAGFDGARQTADTREVHNYARALRNAIKSLDELPLCLRTIKSAHADLLRGVGRGRGAAAEAGEFKSSQNWIGAASIQNARFVPPPPQIARDRMHALEFYIQRETRAALPALLDAALIHYQFETIHPFADGNGRVGRILIPIVLFDRKTLSHPALFMSPYLEARKDEYIDRMFLVSQAGRWTDWIVFFLEAVEETCKQTIETANTLFALRERYRKSLQEAGRSALLLKIVDYLFINPVFTTPQLASFLNITYRSAQNNIEIVKSVGAIEEVPDTSHPKYFAAREIMSTIASGQ